MPPARALSMEVSRTSMESRTRTPGWMGDELSAPATWPMWEWVQTRPGMMVLPEQSMRSAPGGISTLSAGPAARMVLTLTHTLAQTLTLTWC